MEVPRNLPMRGLGDDDAATISALLHAGGDVGRIAHGSVVHAQIVADATDHDEPCIQTLPHLKTEIPLFKVALIALQYRPDAERRLDGSACMIFMGDRCPK